ncbi:MAG: ATP-binding cassette domain-containing protein [Erysipelothrix sp.]|nr:ATP-binding cassette domain-containing protein [Erysipelothrix sp.]
MLVLQNIQKTFHLNTPNEQPLFSSFNFSVQEGEFVVVLGSNGSGKSTLLNLIDGQLSVDQGRIVFNDQEITHLPSFIRRQSISRVYQDPSLGTSPQLSIVQNMSLALNKGKPFNLKQGVDHITRERIISTLRELNMGLEDKLDVKVAHLSGGQRQALSLLMAVVSRPKLLLLDEHTAALDPKTSQHMMKLTQDLIQRYKITTLMITHQIQDAIHYGDRCVMLHEGHVVLDVSSQAKQHLQPHDLLDHFHSLSL